MKLYVGNLSKAVNHSGLKKIFGSVGTVKHIKLLKNYKNNPNKCIAFIEMDDNEANHAISKYNGYLYKNRKMIVSEARERKSVMKPSLIDWIKKLLKFGRK